MSFEASAFDRAFALAATADYADWPGVAEALAREGYGPRAISKLGRDKHFKRALTAAILGAQKAREAAEAELKEPSRMSPAFPLSALGRKL